MPRRPRTLSSTGIYHIILRSVNQHLIFEEDSDYQKFLYILSDCKMKYDIKIYAYCLMDNHIHLLMKGRRVAATLVNQGVDKEKFSGKETERLFIKMLETGLMENGSGNEITVWRASNTGHRILGLETNLSSGTMSVSIAE